MPNEHIRRRLLQDLERLLTGYPDYSHTASKRGDKMVVALEDGRSLHISLEMAGADGVRIPI